jgi:hypothetical protein
MSRVQQNGSKDPASLVDAGLPLRVDHHCQASDPIVVDSCVPPQVQQPADDFLTAIQTYHLEFDVENVLSFTGYVYIFRMHCYCYFIIYLFCVFFCSS